MAVNETTSRTLGVSARSAHRRLGPGAFTAAATTLYVLGLAAQFLTAPVIPLRWALWPFLLAQVVLTAFWYAAHAARLRDANHRVALAQGVVTIHVLAIVLLLLIGTFFIESFADNEWSPRSILLVRELVTFGRGTRDLLTYFGLLACLALLIPPAFSIWAALQPKRTA